MSKGQGKHDCGKKEKPKVVHKDVIFCGNVTIQENLKVKGIIKNVCLDLNTNSPAPPTDEIYNQIELLQTDNLIAEDLIFERVADQSIPLSTRLAGVYGYNADGTLSLNGGQLYNDQLTQIDYRLHAVSAAKEGNIKLDDVVANINISAKWFSERGYPIAPPDTFPDNNKQFNFRTNGLQDPSRFINFSFHYIKETDPLPSALDLVAVKQILPSLDQPQPGALMGAAPYISDLSQRDNRFCYPFRIPITQCCLTFERRLKKHKPIVFYNIITQQLTISLRGIKFPSFANPSWVLSIPPVDYTSVTYFMEGFQGRFQLSKRDSRNNIVSTNFTNAEFLVQVSSTVDVQCSQLVGAGPETDASYSFNYRTPDGLYSGIVIALINGGSPAFDVSIFKSNIAFAVTLNVDPEITLGCNCSKNYGIGDNPNTILKELLSAPSKFELLDNVVLPRVLVFLSESFIADPPIPENVANFPPVTTPSSLIFSSPLNGHEYLHSVQGGLGLYPNIDGEAQAVSVAMDTEINKGIFMTNLPGASFIRFIMWHARGFWPLLETESDNLNLTGTLFGTNGGGLWWNWFAKSYDPLSQVMRRTNDIMSTKYGVLQNQVGRPGFFEFIYYGAANRLSCQQAMTELYNLDFSLIFRDFAISLSLLRNNRSIPVAYHSKYPLWVAQTAYPDATKATLSPVFRHWWSEFDNNVNPSPSSRAASSPVIAPGGRYNTVLPQLTVGPVLNINLEDLSSNIFVVDKKIKTIKVTSNKGRIVVTMHQFTANVPNVDGTFTIQGPFELTVGGSQTFTISDFPLAGLIRLVISNISITDFGGVNNIIINSTDRITGKAILETS